MSADGKPAGEVVGETIVVDETNRGQFQAEVKTSSASFLVDEPAASGGLGTGPNPYDLLSAAIGSCTLMTVRLFADKRKWPLEHVRVKVTHHRKDAQSRDLFVKEIELTGALDETQKARLLDVSKRCPVHLTMTRGSDVETVLLADKALDGKANTLCEHARDVVETCK